MAVFYTWAFLQDGSSFDKAFDGAVREEVNDSDRESRSLSQGIGKVNYVMGDIFELAFVFVLASTTGCRTHLKSTASSSCRVIR
jgi:hypothetical protein